MNSNSDKDRSLSQNLMEDHKCDLIYRCITAFFFFIVAFFLLIFLLVNLFDMIREERYDTCEMDGVKFSFVKLWANVSDAFSASVFQPIIGTVETGEEHRRYNASTWRIRERMRNTTWDNLAFRCLECISGLLVAEPYLWPLIQKKWNFMVNNNDYKDAMYKEKTEQFRKKYHHTRVQICLNNYDEKNDILYTRSLTDLQLFEVFKNPRDPYLLHQIFKTHEENHHLNHQESCDNNCNPFIKVYSDIGESYIRDYDVKNHDSLTITSELTLNEAMKIIRSQLNSQIYPHLMHQLGDRSTTYFGNQEDLESFVFGVTFEDQWYLKQAPKKLRILLIRFNDLVKLSNCHHDGTFAHSPHHQDYGTAGDKQRQKYTENRTRHLVKMRSFFYNDGRMKKFDGNPWALYGYARL